MMIKMKKYLDNAVSALCIALLTIHPVMAQSIVSDADGPIVIDTANGTTMVMINTPDANGVSHNTFVEFGVGSDGAILNNVGENTAETQLGGIIQGNGNLTGGTAAIIINEVTTSNPTTLNGYLEVGGDRADVIVANPYGISCDGCGFINTDRLTITTGTPTYDGGDFTGLSVDGSAGVNIGTRGLDASDSTQFDLISRQITVAGAVQGQRIRVIAGRNDVIYATGEIIEKADDGSTKPTLAIDSTVLGGMYANAITITSTEDGVGVRAPQNMAANAGGMTITADGRLVMGNATASQNVTVQSTDTVEITGNVVAGGDADITSAEDLILAANAKLVADSAAILDIGGDLDVQNGAELAATRFDLDIAGSLRIGTNADVVAAETFAIDATTVFNMGVLASTNGGLLITTSLDLTNEGLLFGDSSVVLRSDESIYNNGGSIIANGDVEIRGDSGALATAFINQYGGIVETITGDISIAAVTFGNLREAPTIDGGLTQETGEDAADEGCSDDTCFDPVTVAGQITVNGEAAQIISAGDINLTGDTVSNAYSLISAGGDINIDVNTLENLGVNVYRDSGGTAEFVGAVFGTIEARGDVNGDVAGYVNNGAFSENTAIVSGPTDTDLSDITLDSIGNPDLFVENEDPDSEFVVETRPEFVDLDQFISSDYFLEAIEYNPELRRFGDAYAEALLIRKQLQELLGQLIVIEGLDERAQIEAMYNNAINELENLDLTPGVALTPEQIGALTSDIIWLEETEINGEIVLAPKVYLANPEIRFAGLSGAMITGQNVNFRTENFDNAGGIRATGEISIVASDTFSSTGGTISAENIAVIANAINVSTDGRTVVTGQGLVKLPLFNRSGQTDEVDVALQTATFEAGSNIVLSARDTITTAGARISAGDNITLLAGGDITIGALQLASATGDRRGSNRNYVERVDHLTTSLTAGGDILLLSSGNSAGQNDIVLEGAGLTAGGDVGLIAQDGDLVLAAVSDFYFRDYRRKSSGFLGFNSKVRQRMTTRITHQVTTIEGASITGVADNNIYVEGSRFTIPGVANDDVAPGQLAMVSVNGSSVFAAPFDIFVETSYRNNSTLWGLVSNSTTTKSAHDVARGVFADTAGDIALNSGGDLTLTAVDFNAGGEFVTQVSGTTYLLAAIEQDYQFSFTHRDNGVIMTDTTVEDISESVTFNRITAAGGVNLDPNSQIVLAGVRDPLFDSAHPAAWTTEAENGRSMLANAYLDIDSPAEDQETSGNDWKSLNSSEEDEEEDLHWREGGEWSEDGDFAIRQVALPKGVDGAEYAYLDGVVGRDDTINEPIELVSYSFYDRQYALNPAFKALVTIAVTQGIGSIGAFQIAADLGLTAQTVNAAGQTVTTLSAVGQGVNAAVASFSSTFVVEATAGVVSGDFDISDVVGQASFSAISAGLTTGVNLDTFGGSFEGVGWANESLFQTAGLGFGSELTFAALVERGIDATITAGLSAEIHETDFLESFSASMSSAAVNLTMADLQVGIGDLGLNEGGLAHAALHGTVGCLAAEALDGNCASGAAAGIAQSIYAGMQEGSEPLRGDYGSEEAYATAYSLWRAQIANQSELLGGGVGYLTSAGIAVNVSNAASIAKSGTLNNYLKHDQLIQLNNAFVACESAENPTNCRRDAWAVAEVQSEQNLQLLEACGTDQICIQRHVDLIAEGDIVRAHIIGTNWDTSNSVGGQRAIFNALINHSLRDGMGIEGDSHLYILEHFDQITRYDVATYALLQAAGCAEYCIETGGKPIGLSLVGKSSQLVTAQGTPNNVGFSNAQLQGAADSIQSQLNGPAANLRVTTVTQAQDGRIIVSTTGGLPTPAQRAEAQRIFGDDVEFVSGGTTTNAVGSTGHHAEQRGIQYLGDDAAGATQASSHYSCDGCAAAQSNSGITNITGNAADNGGQIGRPLDPSQAPDTE
ncbi:filamentous hemagglutinin N-terminal domain-containing protein [Yoonia sp. BS5-3]|uniref:Filamentous hemagglutinin N-terminal domain-containing protein n=1 Tax=Yoonia phaeophyticola TaxID=3137369 RepID=A0ABZ2V896_9RHOB